MRPADALINKKLGEATAPGFEGDLAEAMSALTIAQLSIQSAMTYPEAANFSTTLRKWQRYILKAREGLHKDFGAEF